jgi:hypothetical protein
MQCEANNADKIDLNSPAGFAGLFFCELPGDKSPINTIRLDTPFLNVQRYIDRDANSKRSSFQSNISPGRF